MFEGTLIKNKEIRQLSYLKIILSCRSNVSIFKDGYFNLKSQVKDNTPK